ncbi:MAG TPA: hypothetical protein VLS93_15965 [Anaeromyxobacteraceae bacterium]|nr:hypothetical protein [Anaeromyxobacteraceae bacterium]
MKKLIAAATLAVALTLVTGTVAHAETKMLATVTKIDVAADGGSAVATMKDSKSGQTVEIVVQDKVTLDKFKDKRIVVGDEIKLKYDAQGGRNVATFFKKAAGC